MNEKLRQLRGELEKGRQRMQLLDRERQEVRDAMLRIGGAIRLLEEMIEQDAGTSPAEPTLASV